MGKVRPDVVKHLTMEALDAISGGGVEKLTVAEVMSVCFTLTKNTMIAILENGTPEETEHNKSEMVQAIAALYELVKPKTVN